jgi:hypothetical protein
MGQYMSPYMQNVVAQQQKEAVRQADIARQGTQAQAVRSGAFGGSRGAIVEAENQRGLQDRLAMIQATGTQSAYDKAQQAQQFGANLGLQGLQAGYQGLQTGLQGTAQGMQGAQTGLQGVGQQLAGGQLGLSGAGMGIQGQQAGMQGTAQGLSGVQAATGAGQYGLSGLGAAGSAASTLGALGQTQFGQEQVSTKHRCKLVHCNKRNNNAASTLRTNSIRISLTTHTSNWRSNRICSEAYHCRKALRLCTRTRALWLLSFWVQVLLLMVQRSEPKKAA